MSFGEQLQLLRRGHGLTQEEFAQQLKVSRQAVSKWESSKGYPEIEKIIYICNYYGIPMDELFAEEVPPRKGEDAPDPQTVDGQELKSPGLKNAFGNFFTNLSPVDQAIFGSITALLLLTILILIGITTKGETNQVMMKVIWMGLLILFGVGEALTVGLTSIWFAAGSLVALICALLGGGLWLQIILFFVVTVLSIAAFRPLARKFINDKVEPTNADRIIGREVLVTERISNLRAEGAVSIGGMTWSARSDSEEEIPKGTLVRVLRIEGVKVYVEEVKEETV